VFLAHMVNGPLLPAEHGYPPCLMLRGNCGHDWVKWIKRNRGYVVGLISIVFLEFSPLSLRAEGAAISRGEGFSGYSGDTIPDLW
jgi:hypothetical protein